METKAQNFLEIKNQYPNEWVLLGNPITIDNQIESGVLILHSKNKKEIGCGSKKVLKIKVKNGKSN